MPAVGFASACYAHAAVHMIESSMAAMHVELIALTRL